MINDSFRYCQASVKTDNIVEQNVGGIELLEIHRKSRCHEVLVEKTGPKVIKKFHGQLN